MVDHNACSQCFGDTQKMTYDKAKALGLYIPHMEGRKVPEDADYVKICPKCKAVFRLSKAELEVSDIELFDGMSSIKRKDE